MNLKSPNNSISILFIVKGSILLLCIVLFTYYLVFWSSIFLTTMKNSNYADFGKLYYSAKAFLDGKDMYGPSPSTLTQLTKEISIHCWNLNPPHFHFLLLPLAFLPLNIAFGVWSILSLFSLFVSFYLIFRETGITLTPWRILLIFIGFLVFIGTYTVLMTVRSPSCFFFPLRLHGSTPGEGNGSKRVSAWGW